MTLLDWISYRLATGLHAVCSILILSVACAALLLFIK